MTQLANETHSFEPTLLGGLLSDDTFWPSQPQNVGETGLSESFIEGLILKTVLIAGTVSGRSVSDRTGLPLSGNRAVDGCSAHTQAPLARSSCGLQ